MRMISLVALAAAAAVLPAQDLTKISVEKALGGYQFTEGPVWSREGFLLFSDLPSNRVLQFRPGHPATVFRAAASGANGHTYDPQGRLLSCEAKTRRVTRTEKDGSINVLAEKYEGKRLNAPNDIAVRKDGNIYFTDPAFGDQAEARELDFYGIYRISGGRLELIAKTAGRPNGIALSPKGDLLYVADSDERLIRVFDLDRTGKAGAGRVHIAKTDGPPDGIRTDEKGNLWVACNHVAIYSPEGKPIGHIELTETPRNLAFGDPDFQTLYITAATSVYRVKLDVKGAIAY